MKSTFSDTDCQFLLKDLTDIIPFTPFDAKEAAIAHGHSYSEMITEEDIPSQEAVDIFKETTLRTADKLAKYTGIVGREIFRRGGRHSVIVSLARAGSPIGALLHRYIRDVIGCEIPHYSISIIRGRGMDYNALDYILAQNPKGVITFVDGWTGKGSISHELQKAIAEYNGKHGTSISSDLAVFADPAQLSDIAGTHHDVCIPIACLNSTVSGLVSRTILNSEYIGKDDFHGAVRYEKLKQYDLTNWFLDTISAQFTDSDNKADSKGESDVDVLVSRLGKDFPVADITKVKLGIGEASRALIRRKPYVLLEKNFDNPDLKFVNLMANVRNVKILKYDTGNYECIALIK